MGPFRCGTWPRSADPSPISSHSKSLRLYISPIHRITAPRKAGHCFSSAKFRMVTLSRSISTCCLAPPLHYQVGPFNSVSKLTCFMQTKLLKSISKLAYSMQSILFKSISRPSMPTKLFHICAVWTRTCFSSPEQIIC